jgi:hypothetical protein
MVVSDGKNVMNPASLKERDGEDQARIMIFQSSV